MDQVAYKHLRFRGEREADRLKENAKNATDLTVHERLELEVKSYTRRQGAQSFNAVSFLSFCSM
jgi:hypothetical protein